MTYLKYPVSRRCRRCAAAIVLFITAALIMSFFSGCSPKEESERSEKQEMIDELMSEMTVEEKVGQLFLVCCYDGIPSDEYMEKYHPGGIVLFKSAFENASPEDIKDSLSSLHEICRVPALTAVDEEGGTVTRISCFTRFRDEPFASPREIYAESGMEGIVSNAHEMNAFLGDLGIDMNMAPVCDISTDPSDFMYKRSLGEDAETTSEYAAEVVKACRGDDMICVLKHFPGYGSAADTHYGGASSDRSLAELEESDLLPFRAGIDEGAPAVLFTHTTVNAIDDSLPASLSKKAHDLVRDEMGFEGVIMTDDLSMGAATSLDAGSDENIAVTAVLAGNDMICTGDVDVQYEAVLEAVRSGRISEERLDTSVRRILEMKAAYHLLFNKSSQ